MTTEIQGHAPAIGEAGKLITCVLPDDGTHRTLIHALRSNRKITRVVSQSCLGIEGFADATVKPGTLTDANLVRLVQVVVPIEEADALFEYIHEIAKIGRLGGGVIFQAHLSAATPYELPEGLQEA